MTSKIFVSVANYRDLETINTVRELLAKCSSKSELRVHVLSQLEPEDRLDFVALDGDPRVKHVVTRARDSLGVCWARSELQGMVTDEDYYFQVDSHMAEVEDDWDQMLLEDLRRAEQESELAIITAYPSSYELTDGGRVVDRKCPTRFDVSMASGFPTATSGYVDTDELEEELFVSGNLLFSRTSLVRDVPYDPELFFVGEEITLAVRAYSAGYKIYSPTRYVMAHRYSRGPDERPLYWDEGEDRARKIRWWQRDLTSKWKATHVCRGEWFGKYGIQDSRLYQDFARKLRVRFPGVDLSKVKPREDLEFKSVQPPVNLTFNSSNNRSTSSGWVLSG